MLSDENNYPKNSDVKTNTNNLCNNTDEFYDIIALLNMTNIMKKSNK